MKNTKLLLLRTLLYFQTIVASKSLQKGNVGGVFKATPFVAIMLLFLASLAHASDPLDTWRQRNVEIYIALYGIAYGDGTYVAVGTASDGGHIETSMNGTNWTERIVAPALNSASYGNGAYVVVGANGTIMISTNALDWTPCNSGSYASLSSITYGNRTFVTVGSGGTILTSTDGVAWSNQASGTADSLSGVNYINGRFMALGANGRILSSTNGTNWTSNFASTALPLNSITFGNGRYVAVGGGCPSWPCTDVVATSTDGVNWSCSTILAGNSSWFNGVIFANSTFVATRSSGAIMTSPDGITWTDRGSGNGQCVRGVIYANNLFIAVGDSGTFRISRDALNWTYYQIDKLPATTQRLCSMAYGANTFVAVGLAGTIVTSSDGASWTSRSSETSLGLYSVTFGNGTFVAVGQIIISSSNGITWTVRDSGANYNFEAAAYVNGGFIAVGDNGSMRGSNDGITWSGRTSGTSANLYGVAYGNGTYVVVGAGGTIRTSSDGVTWTGRTSGTVQDLNGITLGNGLFVAQGNSGVICTSPDGTTWTQRSSGTGQGLTTSAFADGKFVTVGMQGTVLSSRNGVNWASHYSGVSATLLGITAGGGTFVAAGDWGTIIQSDPVPMAPVIIVQPQDQSAVLGGTAGFSASAEGMEPLRYQWFFNETNALGGATSNSLMFPSVRLADAGSYSMVVANSDGSATSRLASLTVELSMPTIVIQPCNQASSVGNLATFCVSAESSTPWNYLWQRDGASISGATNSCYTLTNCQLKDSGSQFSCLVSNASGTVASSNATLTVLSAVAMVFANPDSHVIQSNNAPYPSTILVTNVGFVNKVTVTLSNLAHTYPNNLDILLVGPGGQGVMLMSGAVGQYATRFTNITVTFDNAASMAIPKNGFITSRAYRPADYEPGDVMPAPAPARPYGTNLNVFAGANANGLWSLFIVDDTVNSYNGFLANGWFLNFEFFQVQIATALEGTNFVISWPALFSGQLEASEDLNPPTWTSLSPHPPIVEVNGRKAVSLPPSTTRCFYRLRVD